MKNILVTIDFDKSKSLLIEKAFEMGKAFQAKVWLLHIASPLVHFNEFNTSNAEEIRQHRAEELKDEHKEIQEYATALTDRGVNAEGLLIPGNTTELIIEKSKELHVDLIITGHHEHGFFYKAFVGSVSSEIIKQSKIPVMVVPLD